MKTMIIYKSIHHGNTKKVIDVMAPILAADVREVSDLPVDMDLSSYDLIGFGSGIYGFQHHKALLDFAGKNADLAGKKAFIFSTSGNGTVKQHKKLREVLAGKGAEIVDEFACPGFCDWTIFGLFGGSKKGHPDENDLKKAAEFAGKLLGA